MSDNIMNINGATLIMKNKFFQTPEEKMITLDEIKQRIKTYGIVCIPDFIDVVVIDSEGKAIKL